MINIVDIIFCALSTNQSAVVIIKSLQLQCIRIERMKSIIILSNDCLMKQNVNFVDNNSKLENTHCMLCCYIMHIFAHLLHNIRFHTLSTVFQPSCNRLFISSLPLITFWSILASRMTQSVRTAMVGTMAPHRMSLPRHPFSNSVLPTILWVLCIQKTSTTTTQRS